MGWGEPHHSKGSARAEYIAPMSVAPHASTEIPQAAIDPPVPVVADPDWADALLGAPMRKSWWTRRRQRARARRREFDRRYPRST